MRKFNAFTLAEVLITLGIIGVVAAMTMPTLINSTQGAQYKAAYKKALSAISQGVTLNVALDGGSFADTVKGTAGTINPGKDDAENPLTGDTVGSILNSRMNIVKVDGVPTGYTFTKGADADSDITQASADTYLFFNDGILFAYKAADTEYCTQDANVTGHKVCTGFIDVNGLKGPNKVVTCDSGKYTAGTPAKDAVTCGVGAPEGCQESAAQAATEASCSSVTSPTDIYPVMFYDQTILPASAAAKAVLYGK